MTLTLEHEHTTAEREREQTVGLAAVPDQPADEQLEREHDSMVDHGDGGPPPPPVTPRRTLPGRPKRWKKILITLVLLALYFGALRLLVAGFDAEWRRWTTGSLD